MIAARGSQVSNAGMNGPNTHTRAARIAVPMKLSNQRENRILRIVDLLSPGGAG